MLRFICTPTEGLHVLKTCFLMAMLDICQDIHARMFCFRKNDAANVTANNWKKSDRKIAMFVYYAANQRLAELESKMKRHTSTKAIKP